MNATIKWALGLTLLLFVGVMATQTNLFESAQTMLGQVSGSPKENTEGQHSDHHEGHHFTRDGLNLNLTIFEAGGRPEFRIQARDANGQLLGPDQIQLSVELKRLGGQVDTFSFVYTDGVFRSREVVGEPHSFEVTLHAQWNNNPYQWSYSQVEARTQIDDEIAGLSGIESSKAGPVTLKTTVTLTGEVGLDEQRVAHVVPRLDAVVKKVLKHLGDNVRKGDVLALLESRELADAKNQYLKALKKTETVTLDWEQENVLYENTLRMLDLLNQGVDLESLDAQLDEMILGESRAQLVPAYAKWKHAETVYRREKNLFEKKISSESEYLQSREQVQSAKAHFNALRENVSYKGKLALIRKKRAVEKVELDIQTGAQKLLALGLTSEEIDRLRLEDEQRFTLYPLRAPLTGKIIQKHIAVGEAVKADADIFVVADLSELWVNIAIPVKDLSSVHVGQKADIRETHQGLTASGKVSFIGSVINETTRTVTGRVVIANPKHVWRPGMFVTVDLVQEEHRVPVAVSPEAIQSYRGWQVVFVKYGNLYEARPLKLGRRDEQWVEVLDGLRANEPYVSKNSFAIKAELGKSGATHSH